MNVATMKKGMHRDLPAVSRDRKNVRNRTARSVSGLRGTIFAAMLLNSGGPAAANGWANVTTPTPGPARAIGETSRGCIAGAVGLPKDGPGYQVMHLERRRHFGHPDLVRIIQGLGQTAQRERLGMLHVGDLGQPRGGPTTFGHRSHQNGLDVDIWFTLEANLVGPSDPLRSRIAAPSLLTEGGSGLSRLLWENRHLRVLELTARVPKVDRIFVNPHIKRELCRSGLGDRDWLRKIRPWWGHDDHFHARLFCPPDSPECRSQEPLPPGDGCDGSLDWWFRLSSTLPSPGPKAPRSIDLSRMPGGCQTLLFD